MNCKKTFFGYKHNWSKWKDIFRGDIMTTNFIDNKTRRTGIFVYQERECLDCGYKELKKIEHKN